MDDSITPSWIRDKIQNRDLLSGNHIYNAICGLYELYEINIEKEIEWMVFHDAITADEILHYFKLININNLEKDKLNDSGTIC
jgi:hypothetical protein